MQMLKSRPGKQVSKRLGLSLEILDRNIVRTEKVTRCSIVIYKRKADVKSAENLIMFIVLIIQSRRLLCGRVLRLMISTTHLCVGGNWA